MARRNPQNPRYQKDSVGKTRRSAASAKPKRSAGDRSSSSAGKAKSSQPRPKGWRGFFQPLPTPDTPEFKMWRRIWAGLFGVGVVFTLVSLLLQRQGTATQIGTGLLVAAYTCLFGAIYIDITKIRKMRRAYADELEGKASGKKIDSKASSKKEDE